MAMLTRRFTSLIVFASLAAVAATATRPASAADAPFDGAKPQAHMLPGVFCLEFPPGAREPFEAVFTSGNAVHVARATYATHAAYVVASTLPPGRSVEEELAAQRARAHSVQVSAAPLIQTGERTSALGPVLTMRMRDVATRSPRGEFPLELAFHDTAGGAPVSFAASRLFVRGPDRIEVVVLAKPSGAAPADIASRQSEVDALADDLLADLQRCTAALPLRSTD